MGPGMLPVILGGLLVIIGVLLLVVGITQRPELTKPDGRAFLFVLGGTILFALTVDSFGLVPAVTLLTVTSTFADDKVKLPAALVLSGILSLIAYLIFVLALAMPFRIVAWPL